MSHHPPPASPLPQRLFKCLARLSVCLTIASEQQGLHAALHGMCDLVAQPAAHPPSAPETWVRVLLQLFFHLMHFYSPLHLLHLGT